MDIILIAAIGQNRELGKDNQLLWHLSENLKFFKKMTMGKTIVMGRKTFESLPGILPGRRHIVLSKNGKGFPDEVVLYRSVKEILENETEELVVIGGQQIYTLFLEYATKMYLTEIEAEEKQADVYFPEFEKNKWNRSILSEYQEPIPYKHIEYVKKR